LPVIASLPAKKIYQAWNPQKTKIIGQIRKKGLEKDLKKTVKNER
jgi:hypothetical protein